MQYNEFVPRPGLRPFVRLFWTMQAEAGMPGAGADRILPDGCPEIVINRADCFRHMREDGSSERQAAVLLVGPFQRAITIAPSGVVDLFGIRFQPGGMHALLGIPMHEFLNADISLAQVARPLRNELEGAASRPSVCGSIVAIESVLEQQLGQRGIHSGQGGLVRVAVGAVERGLPTVDQITASVGVNRRALERLFRIEVGLTPKMFMRIRRLQSVLQSLDSPRAGLSWARTALEHGYFDQPHLIRDFRLLAGTTPERYLAQRTDLAICFEGTELSHSSNPKSAAAATMVST